MINTQPKEKPIRLPDGLIQVHSIFETIQGEGPFSGVPAIFVRLAGCNLDCPWCDTIYTGGEVKTLSPEEVLHEIEKVKSSAKTKLVVITGGEPFRQDFSALVKVLHEHKFIIQVETNGTLFIETFPYVFTTIVCSPKLGKIHKDLARYVRHYKYVAEADKISDEDGLPTIVLGNEMRKVVARPPSWANARIYLQPMDSKNEEQNKRNLDAVVKSCIKFGHTLCLQTHKIAGVE